MEGNILDLDLDFKIHSIITTRMSHSPHRDAYVGMQYFNFKTQSIITILGWVVLLMKSPRVFQN